MWARLHFPDGTLDIEREVTDEAAFEARWRGVAKVEWLASPHGRLDHLLPQTLPRIVRNANARSPFRRGPVRHMTSKKPRRDVM